MTRINIWQCKDWCCENRPHRDRFWMVRSEDFRLYEDAKSWGEAIKLASRYQEVTA